MGGSVKAIENNFFRKEIDEASHDLHQKIEKGERIIVGLNKYRSDETQEIEQLSVDVKSRDKQIRRLKELRSERSNEAVIKALDKVQRATENGLNVIPPLVEAVKCYATTGEICNCWREVFGSYKEVYF